MANLPPGEGKTEIPNWRQIVARRVGEDVFEQISFGRLEGDHHIHIGVSLSHRRCAENTLALWYGMVQQLSEGPRSGLRVEKTVLRLNTQRGSPFRLLQTPVPRPVVAADHVWPSQDGGGSNEHGEHRR